MTVLVLTGSFRQGSYTRQIGTAIAQLAPYGRLGPDLSDLPFFNQDLEDAPPDVVEQLRRDVRDADTLVIVTPEYNGAVPGVLANALDWLSRPYLEGVCVEKPVVAIAASPGQAGGRRALTALTAVLDNVGARVVAEGVVPEVNANLSSGVPNESLMAKLRELVALAQGRGALAA